LTRKPLNCVKLTATGLGGSNTKTMSNYISVSNPTGSLTVTISPQGAIEKGAKWKVDSEAWQSSGATVSGLGAGSHTLTFSDVAGWTKPGDKNVTITSGQTTTESGTYTHTQQEVAGSLVVTISPQGAIDKGAKWRLDNGNWNDSYVTVRDILVGEHTVSFLDIDEWITPSPITVYIEEGKTKDSSGVYVYNSTTGSIKFTITPNTAIKAGARWRVDGGNWNDSGKIVSGLKLGEHTVEFRDAPGFETPDQETVQVAQDYIMERTIRYKPELNTV